MWPAPTEGNNHRHYVAFIRTLLEAQMNDLDRNRGITFVRGNFSDLSLNFVHPFDIDSTVWPLIGTADK